MHAMCIKLTATQKCVIPLLCSTFLFYPLRDAGLSGCFSPPACFCFARKQRYIVAQWVKGVFLGGDKALC